MTDFTGSNTPAEHRDSWRTPPEIFAALNAEFVFQLDAAASEKNRLCRLLDVYKRQGIIASDFTYPFPSCTI